MINFWKEIQMEDSCTEIRIQTNTDNTGHVFLHSHTFYEILLCKSGNIQYLLGDKRFRIQQGDILLIPPGVSHQPLFPEPLKEPYSRYVIWINAAYWHQQCEEFPDLNFAFVSEARELSSALHPGDVVRAFFRCFRCLKGDGGAKAGLGILHPDCSHQPHGPHKPHLLLSGSADAGCGKKRSGG